MSPAGPEKSYPSAGDETPPVRIPINGVLDLHTFRPAEVSRLVPGYLRECCAAGILQLRIIHGKGTGTLRETVHALLRRDPLVRGFALADETGGGWGATVVELRRTGDGSRSSEVKGRTREDGVRSAEDGGP